MKDLGMFLLVLLKARGNEGQYKQWGIPAGSAAARPPSPPMICSAHYSVCMKQLIIIMILQVWSHNISSDMTYLMWFGLFTGSDADLDDWLLQ